MKYDRQRKTNNVWYKLYIESKKINKRIWQKKRERERERKFSDIKNKQVVTSGERNGKGQDRDRGSEGTNYYI